MAKGIREVAWKRYLEKKKSKKRGTPLVSWGKLSVDVDRLDLQLNTQLRKREGDDGVQQVNFLNEKILNWLKKELQGAKTREIEIYYAEKPTNKIISFYWHVNPNFIATEGHGPVDFEGATTKVIVEKLEEMFTSQGEFVEDVRKRNETGGLVLEHGDQGGTGQAYVDAGEDAEKASKKIRGLKAQKEVLDAIADAVRKAPKDAYLSYIEAAIYDWLDLNFNLTNAMKKDRSIEGINDLWQGEATITLGQKYVPGSTVPANSRKVDNVIRKAFQDWIKSKQFLRDILKHVRKASFSELKKLFAASEPIDEAFVKYGAGAFAAVFTKGGKLDKRYKINKQLLAKADKKKNTAKSRTRGAGSSGIVKNRKARGAKGGAKKAAQQRAIQSPVALIELLNVGLSEEILKRMHPPALRNRTGRFRNSARVTKAIVGKRGGVEIEYTYMRNPYETFEPGGRQGSTYRDPRKIIGESVREIARDIMGKKFIKTRRV